jgi:hypothetical protein
MIRAAPIRVVAVLGLLALAAVVGVALKAVVEAQGGAPLDRPAPEISGGPWINSPPLAPEVLRGRVVFVEFWTYG